MLNFSRTQQLGLCLLLALLLLYLLVRYLLSH